MIKKIISVMVLTLLLLSILTLAFNIQPVEAEPRTWTVDDDGPADFNTIQEAINAATSGDTIYVYNGTYYENVVINRTVTLIGENRENTVIDGSQIAWGILVRDVNYVVASGFTIQHGGGVVGYLNCGGIIVMGNNTLITNNTVTNNLYGIGVVPDFSGESAINNVISGNNVSGNNLQENGFGICVDTSCYNNTISGNSVTAHTMMGIAIGYCSNNSMSGNNITTNHVGIKLWGSSNNVKDNNVMNNALGVLFFNCKKNNVSGNSIAYNNAAISLQRASDYNVISTNTIENNSLGLVIQDSYGGTRASNNSIYQNNFLNNTNQVAIYINNSVNFWDNGYPSGGNFWSDYTGADNYSGVYQNETGNDGMGDTAYVINEVNQDNYPLMHPYGSIRNLDTNLAYLTIQSAINAPETLNGHTIFVETGTYYENVVVNKTVSLVGENNDYTIIDAGGGIAISVHHISNVVVTNFALRNGWSGVSVYRSDQTEISNNVIFNHKQDGIRIDQSERNTISGNVIFNISFSGAPQGGILLYLANNNAVFDNKVYSCQHPGISIASSSNNTISGNTIETNHAGVYVYMGSIGNIFAHNNFVSNTVQVWTDSINIWDNGCEGNYWSDYNGTDSDGDGIGDTPYIIDENNTDHYPLMNPYWLPGDVNHDLKIDIYDVVRITGVYGSEQGDPNWNCHSDIAEPYGIINIYDVVTCTKDYRKEYTP